MARRSAAFADRSAGELRWQAQSLRLAAETAMTRKGMAALLELAEKYEAAAVERDDARTGREPPTLNRPGHRR
jgi:hypothetical protein